MKVYKTQAQVKKDIKNGVLAIGGDVRFECSINIEASINAWNINARDINAWNILYHAVCFAYQNIKCLSIKSKREVSKHFCLDGEITFKNDNSEKKQELIDKAEELKIKADELLEKAEEL